MNVFFISLPFLFIYFIYSCNGFVHTSIMCVFVCVVSVRKSDWLPLLEKIANGGMIEKLSYANSNQKIKRKTGDQLIYDGHEYIDPMN